jgi:hypothetical protein
LPRSALRGVEIGGIGEKAAGEPGQPVRHRVGAEIDIVERDRRRRLVVALAVADQHVGAVAGEHSSASVPAKHEPGSISVTSEREVRSTRLSTRFHSRRISRASQ